MEGQQHVVAALPQERILVLIVPERLGRLQGIQTGAENLASTRDLIHRLLSL